jgi:signal transduction histidine kinase
MYWRHLTAEFVCLLQGDTIKRFRPCRVNRAEITASPELATRCWMKPFAHHTGFPGVALALPVTFVFNTLIALLLTAIRYGDGFYINLLMSQSIGLSICCCVLLVHRLLESAGPALRAALVVVALVAGSLVGSYIGAVATGMRPAAIFEKHDLWQLLLLGVIFGSIITYFFSSRERIIESQARIQEETIKRLTSDKKAAEADLRRLQAQIEPHFLFNILSNVLGLLETDPERGKSMLGDFIQYLRASLSKIRASDADLGQEIEVIRAYLNIFKIRMGDRLQYRIDVPEHLRGLPFPSMLLQPLVENAIRHGLEPRVEGGEIVIHAETDDRLLRLVITDTGLGLSEDADGGLGLTNIRERLHTLYGDRAQLLLEANQPRGLKATVEVPHAGN